MNQVHPCIGNLMQVEGEGVTRICLVLGPNPSLSSSHFKVCVDCTEDQKSSFNIRSLLMVIELESRD